MVKFKHAPKFKENVKLMNTILELILDAYYNIIITRKSNFENINDQRENVYRDELVDAMNETQDINGGIQFILNCETREYKGKSIGRIDIKVQHRHLIDKYSDYVDFYHTFECKRISSPNNFYNYYTDGILDFINIKYSPNNNVAGMICFVECYGCIDDIISNLNRYLLKKDENVLEQNGIVDYEYLYKSIHKREKLNNLTLYHIFLDYSKVYSKSSNN